jgi:hypothetical protein
VTKKCFIAVSASNRNLSKGGFEFIMNLADQCYEEIEIHLYDSLRKYHYQYLKNLGRVPKHIVPLDEALKEGDNWIRNNKKSLEEYKNKITLFRYEDLKKIDPALYKSSKKYIKTLLSQDPNFFKAVFNDMSFNWQGRVARGQEPTRKPTKSFLKPSFNYLADELAIANVLGTQEKDIHGYCCGEILKCFKYFNNVEPIKNLEGLHSYQEESLLPLLTTAFNQQATPDQNSAQYMTKPPLPQSLKTTVQKPLPNSLQWVA